MIWILGSALLVVLALLWIERVLGRILERIRIAVHAVAEELRKDNYQTGLIDKLEVERNQLTTRSAELLTANDVLTHELADLKVTYAELEAKKTVYPNLIKLDDAIYELNGDGEMVKIGTKRVRIDERQADPDPLAPTYPGG